MKYRRLLLVFVALLLAVAAPGTASGAELDTELDRVRDRIGRLVEELASVRSERSTLADEVLAAAEVLDAAELEVAAATAEMRQIEVALDERREFLSSTRVRLAEQFERLAAIRGERDEAKSEAEDWVLQAYMTGGTAQPSIAFSASAVSDISVGVAYMDALAGRSADAADRYEGLVAEEETQEAEVRHLEQQVSAEVAELEDLSVRLRQAQQELDGRRGELAAAWVNQTRLLDVLDGEIAQFEGELAALKKEENSIRRRIAEASHASSTSSVSSSGFVRPVPGAVSSGFGMRVHPITGQNRMHNGVDMDAAHGDPIRSAKAGKVILSGTKGGYGNTVMVDHGGGMVTLYAHQSRLGVSVGQNVAAGQVIGYIGSTGQSTGPHLHFEVRINGVPVNPAKYM